MWTFTTDVYMSDSRRGVTQHHLLSNASVCFPLWSNVITAKFCEFGRDSVDKLCSIHLIKYFFKLRPKHFIKFSRKSVHTWWRVIFNELTAAETSCSEIGSSHMTFSSSVSTGNFKLSVNWKKFQNVFVIVLCFNV